ncbi:MAG TPA: nicotinate-nucleotide adenylyltransferase [Ktedonobacterales bacterium]|jgi:nicotinate-nucleotide adenylyltransferase
MAQSSERPRSIQRQFGVLGGTFDPIHVGHLIVAQEAVSALHLDRLYFLPAGDPPHKRDHLITPAQHRLRMVELAIAGNPAFAISLVDLERPGPSFTVDTLRLLHEQWGPETAIAFVIGFDMLDDLLTWHDPAGVVRQADTLVAVHRPGYQLDPDYLARLEEAVPGIKQRLMPLEAPQIAISSSDLRRRAASGCPIRYQVPDAVEAYILAHGLYRQPLAAWQEVRQSAPHRSPGL